MSSTTLSSKGQLVIPREVRMKLGLSAGDRFLCRAEGDSIVLVREGREKATCRIAEDGLPVLSAPPGAPEMTPERVKEILLEE